MDRQQKAVMSIMAHVLTCSLLRTGFNPPHAIPTLSEAQGCGPVHPTRTPYPNLELRPVSVLENDY